MFLFVITITQFNISASEYFYHTNVLLTDSGRRSTFIWSPSSKPSGTLFCISRGMLRFRFLCDWGSFCHCSSCLRDSASKNQARGVECNFSKLYIRSYDAHLSEINCFADSSPCSHLQWVLWQQENPQIRCLQLFLSLCPHLSRCCPVSLHWASGSSGSEGWWALWASRMVLNCRTK